MEAFWIAAGEENQSILIQDGISICDDFDEKYPQIRKILMYLAPKPKDFLEVLFSKRQPGEKPEDLAERLTREALTAVMPTTVDFEWKQKAIRMAFLQQIPSL